uniref:Zinc finger protein 85 n=1 Tax=Mus musculus TaxID=10090 RepID=F7A6M1_MOUSE
MKVGPGCSLDLQIQELCGTFCHSQMWPLISLQMSVNVWTLLSGICIRK